MSTTEIENILRRAPQPKPPGNLQQKLTAQALSMPRRSSPDVTPKRQESSWLARWWPALAPTAVSLACAATLTVQQTELHRLRANLENPSASAVMPTRTKPVESIIDAQNAPASAQDELARLRNLVTELNSEISKLEQLAAENEKLKAQLAARSAGAFTPEENKAMAEARDQALRIQCVNNLKQLGLAVRIWAVDHNDMTPPDLLSLSNQLGSFKILICPADTGRPAAADAASFTPANCSYEYLAPSSPDSVPNRIAFRCPIHGNLGLCDGSVQSSVAKEHPDWVVQREGKYFMQAPEPPAGAPNQGQ